MRKTIVMHSLTLATLAVLSASLVSNSFAGPITAGNLVVYRVGGGADGSGPTAGGAALTTAAENVWLDEYTTTGSWVQSIQMPTAVGSGPYALTATGNSVSEGMMTLSTNSQFIMLSGYNTAVGGANPGGSSTASGNQRTIGKLPLSTGVVDTSTAFTTGFSSNTIRSVASDNGTNLWISNSGGVRYGTIGGAVGSSVTLGSTGLRNLGIFNTTTPQLYSTLNSGALRMVTVGSGLPTSGSQTLTNFSGLPTATYSPYGFFLFDLSAGVAGLDTLYIVNDDVTVGGLAKYSFDGSTWTQNGSTIVLANSRGLTATLSGGTVDVYVTAGDTLQKLSDSSGYNTAMSASFSSIASAATNTALRGVVITPVPEPTGFVLGGLGLVVLVGLGRRRKSA